MLIQCPECQLQVSDKAYSCPHCGYPLKEPVHTLTPKRRNKSHKRLPNGFGQITKISNPGLRNPYRAMVTTGKNSEGRPICKLLKPQAYFATYNEAYAALMEYNRNPYDLEDDLKLFQLYEKWSKEKFAQYKSDSSIRSITAAWAYCKSIKNMRVKDIRARHIKGVIEDNESEISASTKERIKSLMNMMLDYAVEYELADKNYARTFNIGQEVIDEADETKRSHISFTDDEMNIIWKNINMPYVDIILIQCYMGWRPQELGLIELSNVDLKRNIITGGMKTPAGTMRVVPIHPKIRDLIEKKYKEAVEIGSQYLLNYPNATTNKWSIKLTYDKYRYRFNIVISNLGLNLEHRAHDPRKQFVTMCKKYKVDDFAIKYMVGHAIQDITEKIYTDRDINWLSEEILKIP